MTPDTRQPDDGIARKWLLRRQPAGVDTEAQCRDIQRDENEDEAEDLENTIVHGAPPFAGIRS